MGLSEEMLAAREKVAAEKEAEKKRKQAELDALNAAHKDNLAATGAKSDMGLSEEMLAAREKKAAESAWLLAAGPKKAGGAGCAAGSAARCAGRCPGGCRAGCTARYPGSCSSTARSIKLHFLLLITHTNT